MVTHEGITRDIARIFVWYPVRWFVSVLRPSRGLAVLRLMGNIHYCLSRNKSRMIAGICREITGDKDAASHSAGMRDGNAARSYFQVHYTSQLLVFLFPHLTAENISSIHTFSGLQNLETALAKGKGCILVHGHFGPIHLPLFHFGLAGRNAKQLGYLRETEGLSRIGRHISYRLRQKYEAMIPAEIIQANKFLRPAFGHLEKNGILLTTGDGAGRGELIGEHKSFPFLGGDWMFPLGAARLSQKTGAPIIPMVTVGNTSYTTILHEPIYSNPATSDEEVVSKFVALYETYVRREPYNWHFLDEFTAKTKQG